MHACSPWLPWHVNVAVAPGGCITSERPTPLASHLSTAHGLAPFLLPSAAFTAEELVSHQEIFEHLALRLEKEIFMEVDDIERDVGLPATPIPALVVEELKN